MLQYVLCSACEQYLIRKQTLCDVELEQTCFVMEYHNECVGS